MASGTCLEEVSGGVKRLNVNEKRVPGEGN